MNYFSVLIHSLVTKKHHYIIYTIRYFVVNKEIQHGVNYIQKGNEPDLSEIVQNVGYPANNISGNHIFKYFN